jgi:tetratricopeptide (TPR) repeat protein/predicted Ser/Thr protein kinase
LTVDDELETAPVAHAEPAPAAEDGFPSLGRYVPQEVLGKGGMGVVYRAHDPRLERDVAAKVVRREWLGRDGEARLLREARAMAQTTHPNVVAILDVVSCDAGLVIAMELVDGVDLKTWLRKQSRPWSTVLDTFLEAARGLAAVHAAGLTHRDFKPANVLLSHDGRVMVTDFGLALEGGKRDGALGEGGAWGEASVESRSSGSGSGSGSAGSESGSGSSRSRPTGSQQHLTRTGEVMGTPAYMAPEQRFGARIEPASDQYSFCVALWEGLCGARPKRLRQFSPGDPGVLAPWPAPQGVPKAVGDVLQRGLATDPRERFGSMDALIDALQRARSPRPRRWPYAVGLVAMTTAVAAWAVSPRHDACASGAARLAESWGDPQREAVARSFSGDGSEFAAEAMPAVVSDLDEYATAWGEAHARVCEAMATDSDRLVADRQMACLADRRRALAETTDVLANADHETIQRSLDVTRRLPAIDECAGASDSDAPAPIHPVLAVAADASRALLTRIDALSAGGRYAEALALAQSLPEQVEGLGRPRLHARALFARGASYGQLSRPKEAVAELERAAQTAEDAGDDAMASQASGRMAYILAWDLGQVDEALVQARRALALARRTTPAAEREAAAHSILGVVLGAAGDLDAALEEGQLAYAYYEAAGDTWNADHVRTDLGRTLARQGKLAEATVLFERTLESRRATLPRLHPEHANAVNNVAAAYAQAGDLARAEPLMQLGYELRLGSLGPDHMATIDSLGNLAHVHADLGRFEEAEAGQREALAGYERLLGPKHPRVANALNGWASALHELGRFDEAVTPMRRALDIYVELFGAEHPDVAQVHANLANTLASASRWEESDRHQAAAIATFEALEGPQGIGLASALVTAGGRANRRDDPDAAVAYLERAIAILEPVEAEQPLRLAEGLDQLGRARAARHETAAALAAQEHALRLYAAAFGEDDDRTAETRRRVAKLRREAKGAPPK